MLFRSEKQQLVDNQKRDGREGEVWTRKGCRYVGGKNGTDTTVRTKYVEENLYNLIGITPSTAEGRLIASIEVADPQTGKSVGSVGSGFDPAESTKLLDAHMANPGSVQVWILHQGKTETGQLWHARFLEQA